MSTGRIAFITSLLIFASCGDQAEGECGPSNCAGCCDSAGNCFSGESPAACGLSGSLCVACEAGKECSGGRCESACGPFNCASGCCMGAQCMLGGTNDACGRGGAACVVCGENQICSNGACGEPCDPSNCPDGCCDESNTCQSGVTKEACGTGGATCSLCNPDELCLEKQCLPSECLGGTCSGCCRNNQCMNGYTNQDCGKGGGLCKTCGTDQTCIEGVCMAPESLWEVTLESVLIDESKTWDPYPIPGTEPPDVYVVVETSQQIAQSQTKDNVFNPTFNELLFTATLSELTQNVNIKVWDEDDILADALIGECDVAFNQVQLYNGYHTIVNCGGTDAKEVNFSFAIK